MLELKKLRVRQVSLGHRKVSTEFSNDHLEKLLENGRNLRKSDTPIQCRVKLNSVWRNSNEYLERTRRNREQSLQEGTLPRSVPVEPSLYTQNWSPYPAIIPADGITREGYVKEAWIESYTKSVEIGDQSYDIIDTGVHETGRWIQGFMLGSDNWISLLPSSKIIVKYYLKNDRNTQ